MYEFCGLCREQAPSADMVKGICPECNEGSLTPDTCGCEYGEGPCGKHKKGASHMVEQIKFESAVVSKPFFQAFLKQARQFTEGLLNVQVHRLVEGYDVTMDIGTEKNVLIVKARAKGRGYFVRFHPSFVTMFKEEQNAI